METNIRQLKARLSQLIKQVEAGEIVTVNVHNRAVARIVPIVHKRALADLMNDPGIAWNGAKPTGVARAEAMSSSVNLSDWVTEDRR